MVTRNGQTIMDIALQEYGNMDAIFDIANANDIPVSDLPEVGTILAMPNIPRQSVVVDYYSNNNIHIASGIGII